MADSPTPEPSRASVPARGASEPAREPAFLQVHGDLLTTALQNFVLAQRFVGPYAVAYSGGADSSALLHAAARCWPGQVRAVHVHHGLQAAADDFERHGRQVCASVSVPLEVVHLKAHPQPGQSPEDAARRHRYAALAKAARHHACSVVLLAQHADDQAETVLMALGRGAGLPGLSAMPERFEREGMLFARPFLTFPGADLRGWLTEQSLGFIEDPSNADERYSRNRLRRRLMPSLAEVLPHFRQTFARSARHAAQAQGLLDELAQLDLAQTGMPPKLEALRRLSWARQANALRHWLTAVHQVRPSAAQLDELLAQIQACSTRGHAIELKVGAGRVYRDGNFLLYQPA
ncbi:MAG: tRNA lysidine(34) synthetase TilS [Betaproteobacteria bacterium]|nr:tRNA lysidine(34) synthetase TilS [Betaproteobacteria bacterium]